MDFKKDYYKILGINENATREEIKAAYRSLAMKYHPDRNGGNEEYERIFKEINEANEVLSNDADRFVYDTYRKSKAEEEQHENPDSETKVVPEKNKKTYKRSKEVTREKRIYVTGSIKIKFYAEPENDLSDNFLQEIHYKVYPTDAFLEIEEQNIYPFENYSSRFKRAYAETALFKAPLKQPFNCKIRNTASEELYKLHINDIRIADPVIVDVTKSEAGNFGTISGTFYGYISHFEKYTEEEWVSECFGETGREEFKKEGNNNYFRKEYYHENCTTYWGPWVLINPPKEPAEESKSRFSDWMEIDRLGCSTVLGVLFLLFLLITVPKIFLIFLALGALFSLFYAGNRILDYLSPLLWILGVLLFLLFLAGSLKTCADIYNGKDKSYIRPKLNTNREEFIKRDIDTVKSNTSSIIDSVIRHHIHWKSYDSVSHQITLSVLSSDLEKSNQEHVAMNFTASSEDDFSSIYNDMLMRDKNRIQLSVKAFDSVRKVYKLNSRHFAELVVSCIQSIPYSLVIDRSCDARDNQDSYVKWFLSTCNGECCIPYQKYGVRSPAEFLGDLRGDCDTRVLFLYSLLRELGYDVAVLISTAYKHSILAVQMDEMLDTNRTYIIIGGKRYYLWETTSFGFKPGEIPNNISNLNYWKVSNLSNQY